jgi:hypothetical protein
MAAVAAKRSSLGSRLRYGFKRQLLLAAPASLRSLLRRSGGAHLDRLVGADVILLLAPLDDVVDRYLVEQGGEFDESWVTRPSYLTRDDDDPGVYDRLGEACAGSSMPDVYVVATDADVALEIHGSETFRTGGDRFLNFLRTDLLGLGAAYRGRVLPVDGDDSEGYDDVLGRL